MRQLICRRTCEWLEIGYTYRAVRISYLVRLAEVAHIHIGYCKITTCYRARPDKRAQRCSVSSFKNVFSFFKKEESQMAIFYFARCTRKLLYYGEVIRSFDWKSAVEHDGGV